MSAGPVTMPGAGMPRRRTSSVIAVSFCAQAHDSTAAPHPPPLPPTLRPGELVVIKPTVPAVRPGRPVEDRCQPSLRPGSVGDTAPAESAVICHVLVHPVSRSGGSRHLSCRTPWSSTLYSNHIMDDPGVEYRIDSG